MSHCCQLVECVCSCIIFTLSNMYILEQISCSKLHLRLWVFFVLSSCLICLFASFGGVGWLVLFSYHPPCLCCYLICSIRSWYWPNNMGTTTENTLRFVLPTFSPVLYTAFSSSEMWLSDGWYSCLLCDRAETQDLLLEKMFWKGKHLT